MFSGQGKPDNLIFCASLLIRNNELVLAINHFTDVYMYCCWWVQACGLSCFNDGSYPLLHTCCVVFCNI